MMPGLTNGEADWNEYAQGLTRAALLASSAARVKPCAYSFQSASPFVKPGIIIRLPPSATTVATVVAEGGNLMMMPGLTNGEADWNEYAQGLTRAALLAKSAAEAQDADALFAAGGAIYNVCRACHNKYMEQYEFQ